MAYGKGERLYKSHWRYSFPLHDWSQGFPARRNYDNAKNQLILEIGNIIINGGKETDKEIQDKKLTIKYYDGMNYAFDYCLNILKCV